MRPGGHRRSVHGCLLEAEGTGVGGDPLYLLAWPLLCPLLCAVPLSSVIPYTHFDVQFIEKFGVTFRREGETLTLKCTLLVTPDLKRVQPRAEWYRDGEWPWALPGPLGWT